MDRRVLTVLLILISLAAIVLVIQLYDMTSATNLHISPTANPTIVKKNATDMLTNLTPSATAADKNSSLEEMMNNTTLRSNTTEQPAQAMPPGGPGGTPPEGFNGAPPGAGAPPEGMPSGGTPPEGMSGTPPDGVSPVPNSATAGTLVTPTISPDNNRSMAQSGLNGRTTSTMTDFSSWMPTVKPINMSKFLNMSIW